MTDRTANRDETDRTSHRCGALLEVTRLVRAREDLPALLDAVARTIGETLGFRTVAVNLYRPAWDDFEVAVVHGNDHARGSAPRQRRATARNRRAALPAVRASRRLLRARRALSTGTRSARATRPRASGRRIPTRGIPRTRSSCRCATPTGNLSASSPSTSRSAGRVRATRSSTCSSRSPITRRSPSRQANETRTRAPPACARGAPRRVVAHHRRDRRRDEILRRVCGGIHDALGFENVRRARRSRDGRLVPRAAAGWRLEEMLARPRATVARIEPLLDAEFEREGCFLLRTTRRTRVSRERGCLSVPTERPRAVGVEPALAPRAAARRRGRRARPHLGGQPERPTRPVRRPAAGSAYLRERRRGRARVGEALGELRFLADHDPLTRLLNRRAFVARLDGEVARATRYGRTVGLVIADLDGSSTATTATATPPATRRSSSSPAS